MGAVACVHATLFSPAFSDDEVKLLAPVILDDDGSDTAAFDNCLELLVQTGRSVSHAMAMMAPEAWATKASLPRELKGFFECHATMMEPWDGPANSCPRWSPNCGCARPNGLRPTRLDLDDDDIIYASEAGVLTAAPEKSSAKIVWHRQNGLIDTVTGTFSEDATSKPHKRTSVCRLGCEKPD